MLILDKHKGEFVHVIDAGWRLPQASANLLLSRRVHGQSDWHLPGLLPPEAFAASWSGQ
jgi:hypothetical protein